MIFGIRCIVAFLLLVSAATAIAVTDIERGEGNRYRYKALERISEYKPLETKLAMKKEETEVHVLHEDTTLERDEELPEYFGALPGGIVSFAFLTAFRGEYLGYYELEGPILLLGICIGFLYTFSTRLRIRSIEGCSTSRSG